MKPRVVALSCAFLSLSFLLSCTESPTQENRAGQASDVLPQPSLIPSAADASALPIHRIRAVTTLESSGAVIDMTTVDVSPTAPSWSVVLLIPMQGESTEVIVSIYLINVSGEGAELVQFSGRSAPITLAVEVPAMPDIPIVRGPIENLATTGVSITAGPYSLASGASATLTADATTTTPATPPTVFWSSLDPDVITMDGSAATAVGEGPARLVASSGAHADTVTVLGYVPETTPPTVVSAFPSPDATGVSRGATAMATFDEEINPTTLTASTFTLRDPQGVIVPGTITYAEGVAALTTSAPLGAFAQYTVTLTTGVQDLSGNGLASPFVWSFTTGAGAGLIDSFDAGLGALVGVAFDPVSGNLFLYGDFTTVIEEFTTDGTAVAPTIPHPGVSSNDIDLDFLSVSADIGGTVVPANSLLVFEGERGIGELFAVNKNDGTVLSSDTMAIGSQPVGGSFHPGRSTFFGVNWVTDEIYEMSPATGEVLNSFTVSPVGGPAFDVLYGDIEVDPATGNLLIVSNAAGSSDRIRIMSPTGVFIRDVDVGALGIGGTGIAWDSGTGTAWIVSTNGLVYHVDGIPTG